MKCIISVFVNSELKHGERTINYNENRETSTANVIDIAASFRVREVMYEIQRCKKDISDQESEINNLRASLTERDKSDEEKKRLLDRIEWANRRLRVTRRELENLKDDESKRAKEAAAAKKAEEAAAAKKTAARAAAQQAIAADLNRKHLIEKIERELALVSGKLKGAPKRRKKNLQTQIEKLKKGREAIEYWVCARCDSVWSNNDTCCVCGKTAPHHERLKTNIE